MTPAIVFVTVFAALFGLAIGSFLNVVAYRLPRKISLLRESRCPNCRARIRWYQNIPVLSWFALKGRCATCWERISPRYAIVEGATGLLFALVALGVIFGRPLDLRPVDGSLWFTSAEFWGILLTLEVFAAFSVVLTLIDLDSKRLPNTIVLPGWAAIIVLLLVTTLLTRFVSPAARSTTGESLDTWWPFLRALIGGAALFLFYYVVRLISPRGMGGGDVKLAGLVGTMLGWFGWGALVFGAFAAFVLGAAYGGILLLTRRAKRKSAIPFGPWILLGAWAGIVVGEPIGRWYVGLMS
ncbi:leader peptidase (prepilin peptidase)/N-methyltransferase [Microbacterium sp. W4I4]|uniref:prepilin peptidase n=1 Tax=Microbacterium sp. W4I4 TaxID=3042295 RepID=UPI00277EB655|nr:A24 family peptidase [Microbacterium sp. W4I4]MDQ0614918.1 leader peptidase (prepilin peptidase)/N-methyltransferase [Microbacterium sp. W4I4]